MAIGDAIQGSLFALDFLCESIADLEEWQSLDAAALDDFDIALRAILERFPTGGSPNESQTEDDLIWPVLERLGWGANLRQQNLSLRGRQDVPDGLLFADQASKNAANALADEWKRYELGLALVEAKRWRRPLDRRSGQSGETTAPSTQMLRYLRRVDDLTTGALRWGILTNGARWRLYYQGARSISEQFFELDLSVVLAIPNSSEQQTTLEATDRLYLLKVFALMFRREAFLAGATDARTFHQRALDEGRYYEERVAGSLSGLVFDQVFPQLARAIAVAAPAAPLEEVRQAALILLYRLLFILYAEDRDLLPVRDRRYDDYALRDRVRGDVGRRKDVGDTFSTAAARYWSVIDDLCRAIDDGDASIGLPPYNGGLFNRERTPLLAGIRLGDSVMADVIDSLSFEQTSTGRRYINYRDLGVQQLGSIYERLLEHEVVREGGDIVVRPNVFARKGSGSYYTPDDLVGLIIRETIEPLVKLRMDAFMAKIAETGADRQPRDCRHEELRQIDPAEKLLELKICDPAMGSGHFLVNLIDQLADRVIEAVAEAEAAVEGYISPLTERIEGIRNTILGNAERRGWTIDPARLDDRHVMRRMVLKRCVHGVDRNPMAVELAKVALWLHTFTVGAPLSFLDHHLRCGNSLFGMWVNAALDVTQESASLYLREPVERAAQAASSMRVVEGLTDAEIAEAHRSAGLFAEVEAETAALNAFLSLLHAFVWHGRLSNDDQAVLYAYFEGKFGDPLDVAMGTCDVVEDEAQAERFVELLAAARSLIAEEGFFHWQVAFPGVWVDWEDNELQGGFDAVIGNPPWDRMKLQQVEWFAARRQDIALAPLAVERKRMIAKLEEDEDPLARDFALASRRAMAAIRAARSCGDYPLLSGGDLNLYSLFVERAMTLVKPDGVVGLLVPSGIASDKTAAKFFREVASDERLRALYDFENRRTRYSQRPFFPDVHSSFKFCALVAGRVPSDAPAKCAFFLHGVNELDDPERCFELTASDFVKVNPNTGTAPIFRHRRDAELTTAIYDRCPVLVDRSTGREEKAWPVKYRTMFHMTNDSGRFRTREELEEREGGYPIGGNRYRSPTGDWVPLYVGRMIHQFDHRAASVEMHAANIHNPALSAEITPAMKADPKFVPTPQYWVPARAVAFPDDREWGIAFRDIARATDSRTMIAAAVPLVGLGNTAPAIFPECADVEQSEMALLLANLGAIILDYVVRQKTQSAHVNWYLVEQLPVVPRETYETVVFGSKTAGEIVRAAVLELTYTAHDMAPFASSLGYLDGTGKVKKPFQWNDYRRLHLRAKLDAVFCYLYGVVDRDDIRYVYATFPTVERHERATYGAYRSRDLCLAWMNALANDDPDAEIKLCAS